MFAAPLWAPPALGESGAGAAHDRARGHKDNLQVKPEAPVLNVSGIERNIALKGGILARSHLPQAGQPWEHLETAKMFDFILGHFAGDRRPRPHNAHIPLQHIEQLRQLVEAVLAQEPADPGDPWVVLHLEENAGALVLGSEFSFGLLGIQHHGAELVAGEDRALLADPLGDIKHWAPVLEADCNGHRDHNRSSGDQRCERQGNIEDPLERHREQRNMPAMQSHYREIAEILDWRVLCYGLVIPGKDADVQVDLPGFLEYRNDLVD